MGDIQITGVTSDANDSFTFVLWRDIAANTVIRFMDQSFTNATNGLIGSETDMSLTFNTALTAGTVVRVEDTGTTLVNGGTFNGTKSGSLSGISASGDQVFIYQGAAVTNSGTSFSGRTLLYGVNISSTSWVTSGVDSNNSFLPNAINSIDANLDTDAFENADYSGARTGLTTAFYRAAAASVSNYTQSNTRSNLATGSFTIASTASVTWDNNGETSGTGGTGIWDSITKDKWSNSGNTTFFRWVNPSVGTSHNAVFAGTAGTVSVASGGVTASGLQFGVNGYTLQNNAVTLSGASTPALQVTTSGHTAIVSSTLAGNQGFTKTGNGILRLTGNNTISGDVSVTAGTLQLSTASNQALGQATSISVSNGTLLLGASDEINNTADLTLGTGGIFNLAGFSEGSISADGLGTLILTGNATFDFGTAASGTSILRFEGAGTRSGKLSLLDYDIGTDRLLFTGVATDPGSFGSVYGPGDISFNGMDGFAAIQFGGYYEIVPVPEPGTILGASALLGLVAWRERRRWLGRRVSASV